jgi:hypothetical protein
LEGRCREGKGKRPSGTSSAGGHEAAAARGGERRRADAGAGWWEMGSDENGRKRMEKPYFYFRFYTFFSGNRIRFGNRIEYGWRAKKLS